MLAENIEFIDATNSYTSGFLVVGVADHDEVHGYVCEHRLADGTTTWVAQQDRGDSASRNPRFQSKEWAGQFLYDHEWPTYIRRG